VLPATERGVLLRACLLFFVVELGLRVRAFPHLVHRLERVARRSAPLAVERVTWLVEVASRAVPFQATCLTRALVLGWLLARQGMPVRLRFGVARSGGELRAHAWLESDGRPIFGLDAGAPWVPLRVAGR
jgi:Transglutaminase-like superfamily